MNFRRIITTVVTACVLLSPFWIAHLVWRLFPVRELSMLVVDYTVPTTKYSHHQGLFWLLNYIRIKGPGDDKRWQVESDYVGYKPGMLNVNQRLHETPLAPYDWIYIADTYGVYDTDLMVKQNAIPAVHPPQKLVFGALINEDVKALEGFVKRGGSIVLEFNTFSGPTQTANRKLAESLVGVHWTGWAGRFFPELSDKDTLPVWFPRLFKLQYPDRPLPTGPGIMLIHNKSKIVVLEGRSFRQSIPWVRTTSTGRKRFSGPHNKPSYFGWFAIVDPELSVNVLAEIFLPISPEWKRICRKANIPIIFPLLTELRDIDSSRYYIAANIANLQDKPGFYQLAGMPSLQAAVNRRQDDIQSKPAYWQFYVPIMSQIFKKAAK